MRLNLRALDRVSLAKESHACLKFINLIFCRYWLSSFQFFFNFFFPLLQLIDIRHICVVLLSIGLSRFNDYTFQRIYTLEVKHDCLLDPLLSATRFWDILAFRRIKKLLLSTLLADYFSEIPCCDAGKGYLRAWCAWQGSLSFGYISRIFQDYAYRNV